MSCVSLAVRLTSMLISVRFNNTLGAQGVGIYQLVMSIYVLANGLSSSGICVAVSRLTAQECAAGDEKSVRGVLRVCVLAAGVLSFLSCAVLFFLSGIIGSYWLHDERSIGCLRVIAFAIPFMSISNCVRGWYTAKENAVVPVCSQLSEQSARLSVCFFLLPAMAEKGLTFACIGAVLSDVAGEFSGCLFIVLTYLFGNAKKKSAMPEKAISRLFDTATPITASFYLTNILRSAETAIVPSCLIRYGMSRQEALSQLGILQGMALTMLFIPASLLIAISTLMLPKVAYFNSLPDSRAVKKCVERSLYISFLFSAPSAAVFCTFSKELSILLYGQPDLIKMVSVLSPMIPMMYSEMICSGLLKGLGEQKHLLYYALADAAVRLILIALLVPEYGMNGMLAVMLVSNILTPVLCAMRLKKLTGAQIIVVKPILCSLAAAPVLLGFKSLPLSDLICVTAGIVSYLFVFLCFLIPGYIQMLPRAVLRVCLRTCSGSRYTFCRQEKKDNLSARPSPHSHSHRRNKYTGSSRPQV